MTRIDLFDDILIDFSKKDISIECKYKNVPNGRSNIAFQAAVLFYEHFKKIETLKDYGLFIKIRKRIPPKSGLGGGSSNAALVLKALNEYYNKPFSRKKLRKIGQKIGADIPFFLFGKPAIAYGIGEKLKKAPKIQKYSLILCDPGVKASTAKVFKNTDLRLTAKQNCNKNSSLNPLSSNKGLNKKDLEKIMYNELEDYASKLYPQIRKTKKIMAQVLQKKICMTGSGSFIFALFSNYKKAKKGYEALKKSLPEKRMFVCSFK